MSLPTLIPRSQTMSFHLRKALPISAISRVVSCHNRNHNQLQQNFQTGLTGKVDPSARKNLLKLYGDLEIKLKQLPIDYGYRNGMLTLLEERNKLIKDDSLSDYDLELKIGKVNWKN